MNKPIPFGKYYLLERINIGGMAEVFRAKAYGVEGFERLVAVKRILPNIAEDKEFIEMFVDEAKIAVQLNHANVAQIFDLGRAAGSYYIALEHVHGRDLRALFDRCAERREHLPLAQAIYITMKVCEGLDYAHNKRDQAGRPLNLVHRDVSPQNVLVSFEGEVKVIDFGIAKAAGKGAQTRSGILKGKFGYMSPEQVRGLPIDRRSDVFSCGIVLYELITGERLFLGASDFSTLEKVRNVEILPPSTYNRDIPEELERIVLKALARDLDERYQNAIDLHDALQSFVYAAGAFGSRKDLAAWMKGMFAREIEEETAKLESYRHVRPPPPPPEARRASSSFSAMPAAALPRPANHHEGDEEDGETRVYSQDISAPDAGRAGGTPPWADATIVAPAPVRDADGTHEHEGFDGARVSRPSFSSSFPSAMTSPSMLTNDAVDRPPASPWDVIAPGVPSPPARRSGAGRYAGAAAVAVLLLGSGLAAYEWLRDAGEQRQAAAAGLPADVLAATGVDLFIEPREATIKLDGRVQPMSSPMRLRGLEPGMHELIIDGPPGFYSKTERITVSAGKAEMVQVSLDPLNITGTFASEPPGAAVSLVINGDRAHPIALGPAPAAHALDPRKRYEVVFEKDGYERVTMPVRISGGLEEQVTAVLAPRSEAGAKGSAGADAVAAAGADGHAEAPAMGARPAPVAHRASADEGEGRGRGRASGAETARERAGRGAVTAARGAAGATREAASRSGGGAASVSGRSRGSASSAASTATAPATGTLMLGSKPPCRILVDGKDTGKVTPQRDLALPSGRRRITLMNREYGIEETFVVEIQPGKTERVMKDMSDRI